MLLPDHAGAALSPCHLPSVGGTGMPPALTVQSLFSQVLFNLPVLPELDI